MGGEGDSSSLWGMFCRTVREGIDCTRTARDTVQFEFEQQSKMDWERDQVYVCLYALRIGL